MDALLKKRYYFYIALLDQMVSVALYNLTPGRGLTQPWCEPSPWGDQSRWAAYIPCMASAKYLSSLCFCQSQFYTLLWWSKLVILSETCSAFPPAAVMVVMAVGIEPGPPTYKPCLLTTTSPWLQLLMLYYLNFSQYKQCLLILWNMKNIIWTCRKCSDNKQCERIHDQCTISTMSYK